VGSVVEVMLQRRWVWWVGVSAVDGHHAHGLVRSRVKREREKKREEEKKKVQ
jgi:hypothetical protein